MKDFWNKRYSEDNLAYGEFPNDFLNENLSYIPECGKVLCIAEGQGRNALFLARQGFQVTAVDYSEVGIKKIQEQARDQNLKLKTFIADLKDFDFGIEKWDGVISIFCHLPSSLRKEVHQRITPSLTSTGVLLLEAYTPKQLDFNTGGPKDPDMFYSSSILAQDFPDLKILSNQECIREIHEGIYHQGMSAVVQLIATKK